MSCAPLRALFHLRGFCSTSEGSVPHLRALLHLHEICSTFEASVPPRGSVPPLRALFHLCCSTSESSVPPPRDLFHLPEGSVLLHPGLCSTSERSVQPLRALFHHSVSRTPPSRLSYELFTAMSHKLKHHSSVCQDGGKSMWRSTTSRQRCLTR